MQSLPRAPPVWLRLHYIHLDLNGCRHNHIPTLLWKALLSSGLCSSCGGGTEGEHSPVLEGTFGLLGSKEKETQNHPPNEVVVPQEHWACRVLGVYCLPGPLEIGVCPHLGCALPLPHAPAQELPSAISPPLWGLGVGSCAPAGERFSRELGYGNGQDEILRLNPVVPTSH